VQELSAADGDAWEWTRRAQGDHAYDRLAIKTAWLHHGDDLATALSQALPPLRGSDTILVSEKVAALLTGRTVPMATIRPGRLARLLARCVRPRQGSRGLSVPEKMQYVLEHVGAPRLMLAAGLSAVTLALGRSGDFYRVAGPLSRDVDGGRPPYENVLFPPLPEMVARHLCAELEGLLGAGVAIVDINDFGGTVRATSDRALPPAELLAALADNPLGQRSNGTPFGLVRRVIGSTVADVSAPN